MQDGAVRTEAKAWPRRRVLLLGGGAVALAAGGAAMLNPARLLPLLDGVDRLLPGDAPVRRVAGDVAFGSDPRQRLDVYAPARAPRDAALPVVLFFYGGSWSSGRRRDYGFAGRALAARGFISVVPDYRLVPQVQFPAFVADGAAALGWVVANIAALGGDPARIGVSGHSAGAYNAAMLALDPRWGNGAVRAFVGLAGPYDFFPYDTPATRAAFAGAPDPALTQPVRLAHRGAPPSLLLSGTADTTVRSRNSRKLAAALDAVGAPVAQIYYPDVTHSGILMALARPFRHLATTLDDSAAFLATHLKRGQ